MSIKVSTHNGCVVLKANQKVKEPVAEVLALLSEGVAEGKGEVFIDLSALKRSRLSDANSVGNLYVRLPNQTGVKYFFGLPDNMVAAATTLAKSYEQREADPQKRPRYMVATGDSLTMMANQR